MVKADRAVSQIILIEKLIRRRVFIRHHKRDVSFIRRIACYLIEKIIDLFGRRIQRIVIEIIPSVPG